MPAGRPDAADLVHPPSDWPSNRPAPGELELVRRFCNTINLESGDDLFASDDGVAAWMRDQGRAPAVSDADDRVVLIELREAIRALAVAHQERRADPAGAVRLAALAADVPLRVDAVDGQIVLGALRGDWITALRGDLLAAIARAEMNNTWSRLKACANCRWVLYDHSKNMSSRWCSMRACGGRDKVRNYRARQRQAR